MASPSTEAAARPPTTIRDVIVGHHDFIAELEEEDEEEDEEEEEWDMSRRMSRLSMEGSDGGDADDENDELDEEDGDDEFDEARSDVNAGPTSYRPYDEDGPGPAASLLPSSASASLPGTPDRGARWAGGPSGGKKEYASETEARWPPPGGDHYRRQRHHHSRRERVMREVWLERAWRLRKQRRQMMQAEEVVPVVVLGGEASGRGGVAMDMEEVRACRDLGLDLPCDWTVEIPSAYGALSGVDTASSGGNSPASGSWRISSPGDDPQDVKARLKVWAQAVALASASRLGS